MSVPLRGRVTGLARRDETPYVFPPGNPHSMPEQGTSQSVNGRCGTMTIEDHGEGNDFSRPAGRMSWWT